MRYYLLFLAIFSKMVISTIHLVHIHDHFCTMHKHVSISSYTSKTSVHFFIGGGLSFFPLVTH